jgi:hypothetical protein
MTRRHGDTPLAVQRQRSRTLKHDVCHPLPHSAAWPFGEGNATISHKSALICTVAHQMSRVNESGKEKSMESST